MNWFHYAAPQRFYPRAGKAIPWFGALAAVLGVAGLVIGLLVAPTDHQAGDAEHCGDRAAPRHSPAGERMEALRRRIVEPVETRRHDCSYSIAMRKACAVAHGARNTASASIAPSNEK